jgi:hypothetical protein
MFDYRTFVRYSDIFANDTRQTGCRQDGELVRHREPTNPARRGRPDDKLRDAIQLSSAGKVDCFVASLRAMTALRH